MDNVKRIRQAAILMASVQASTAQRMLAQMPSEMAKQIRRAMIDLGRIDAREQQSVLADFQASVNRTNSGGNRQSGNRARATQNANQAGPYTDEFEFSGRYSQPGNPGNENQPGSRSSNDDRPLWSTLPPHHLAELIASERPTVIAVVLSQLEPSAACKLVAKLPEQQRTAALAQLADLQFTDSDIIAEIHNHLQRNLAHYRPISDGSQHVGLTRLQAILAVSDSTTREHVLKAVASQASHSEVVRTWFIEQQFGRLAEESRMVREDRPEPQREQVDQYDEVVEQFAAEEEPVGESQEETPDLRIYNGEETESHWTLEHILHLSPDDLVAVIEACDPSVVLLALSGAPREIIDKVRPLFASRDWKRLQSRLGKLGPLQLRDVDRALGEFVATAEQLWQEGRLQSTFGSKALPMAA